MQKDAEPRGYVGLSADEGGSSMKKLWFPTLSSDCAESMRVPRIFDDDESLYWGRRACGGIGIRSGLKIRRGNPCGFESRQAH